MPEKVDRCVAQVLSNWNKNPKSKPEKFKSGDKWKEVKSKDDLKSAAWAICQARVKAERTGISDITLGSDGYGPTLIGVAALNDPHITGMERSEIVERDGKKFIKGQVLRFGVFRHSQAPEGRIVVNQDLYDFLETNFAAGVLGRTVFLDPAHEPNKGSYGDVVQLEQADDALFYYADPTSLGLEAIGGRIQNYSSVWMHFNWKGTEIRMSSSEMVEDDLIGPYSEEVDMSELQVEPKTSVANPDPPAGEGQNGQVVMSREELQQLKDEVRQEVQESLEVKYVAEIKELISGKSASEEEYRKELELMRAEKQERMEELRLERVDLFVESLKTPDRNGNAMALPAVEVVAAALRGETIGEDEDGELRLSAEPEDVAVELHAYYRGSIERIAAVIPRTVSMSKHVESLHRRPGDKELKASRDAHRARLIRTGKNAHGLSDKKAEERADEILAKEDEDA